MRFLLDPKTPELHPIVRTAPLPDDADDPAIWIHPHQPRLSLILGTNKARAPKGAIGVFDLNGRLRQLITHIDQPNNIDVAYGFALGRERIDIAVATERYASRLRIFRIDPNRRRLVDITDPEGAKVFAGETGERAMPMGIALYQAGRGEVHAIVSRKSGPKQGYLHQYRLVPTRNGRVGVRLLRAFGEFSGEGEIEAVCVDSELGYVYYADEGVGIRKYYADPRMPERELALFATEYEGDQEGIAIYAPSDGGGYLLCTEQIEGGSKLHIYPRYGKQGMPLATVQTGADATDGLDASASNFGAPFQTGMVVAMNSAGRNFWVYSWADIQQAARLRG
ncbi:MAG: 3-phytase [Armatimonadetes bacterium CP1_7O]|nr:MAG: 3-phytase [Armatimonadetes bacterium CP1_7O]